MFSCGDGKCIYRTWACGEFIRSFSVSNALNYLCFLKLTSHQEGVSYWYLIFHPCRWRTRVTRVTRTIVLQRPTPPPAKRKPINFDSTIARTGCSSARTSSTTLRVEFSMARTISAFRIGGNATRWVEFPESYLSRKFNKNVSKGERLRWRQWRAGVRKGWQLNGTSAADRGAKAAKMRSTRVPMLLGRLHLETIRVRRLRGLRTRWDPNEKKIFSNPVNESENLLGEDEENCPADQAFCGTNL